MYTQDVNLNVVPVGVRPVIHCSQYDNNLQAIRFALYKNNTAFAIPSGAAVLINGYKPDNTGFSYAATAISGNTVTFAVTQQMTAIAGDVLCELRVKTESQVIGTLNFVLRVEPAPLTDDTIISETDIPLIEQAVDIAANLAEYIQQTLNARDDAQTAAADAAASATDAATDAASAASDAASVQNLYDSIETAKQGANAAAHAANTAAASLSDMTATATTLQPGSSATASYDANNKRFTFGIPQGAKGDSGIVTPVSGFYTLAVDDEGYLYCYSNDEITESMFYYDEEEGNLYWMSPTTPIVTSVSGNMVTFVNKSSAENAVEVTSGIAPIQSFNGYDKPWPAGGGKNKFDPSVYSKYIQSDGKYRAPASQIAKIYIPIPSSLLDTPCTFSCYADMTNSGTLTNVLAQVTIGGTSKKNGNFVQKGSIGRSTVSFTPTSTKDYVSITFESNGENEFTFYDIQLEASSAVTDFAPYENICPISGRESVTVWREASYDPSADPALTIQLGTTVYGGTVDVVSGVMTITKANIASYNGEEFPGEWISDRDVYAEGTVPTTGAQVVYDLASPVTVQLDPHTLKLLHGTNKIWSDSGAVTVQYNRWELE